MCSSLAALDHANSKYTKGYAMSGIVCTTCWHEFILPEGARPLQKGKQFVFILMLPIRIVDTYQQLCEYWLRGRQEHISQPWDKEGCIYDIMCQWGTNLWKCLKDFLLHHVERLDNWIIACVVPKFHLATHKEDCWVNFSLNYKPGVGRSNMEGPEQMWFGLQGRGSTKDQGPGYWSDAMDDKFGHWNWSKLIHLGKTLPSFL